MWVSVVVVGLVTVALGLLWFLQGSDLLHIDPIACATDCEPVVGHHPAWQVAGTVAVVIGTGATAWAVRKLRYGPADGKS